MAERKTLQQLTEHHAARKTLDVEVIGVVHKLERLEENFKGRAGVNPNATGRPRRAFWLVDSSQGPGHVVAAKCFLWGDHATQLGDRIQQDVEAGRVPVLAVRGIKPDMLERGQLGTDNKGPEGETAFRLDPPPPPGLGGVAPLGDEAAARALRDWYRGEGVAAAAEAARLAGNRLIRAKGNPDANPQKQGTFASAPVGGGGGSGGGKGKGASLSKAPLKKRAGGAGGGQGAKAKKAKASS